MLNLVHLRYQMSDGLEAVVRALCSKCSINKSETTCSEVLRENSVRG